MTLLERLKAAKGGDREIDGEIGSDLEGYPTRYQRRGHDGEVYYDWPPITSSIDAALALVEARLPGWKISVFINHLTGHKKGEGARAELHSPKLGRKTPEGFRWPKVSAVCYYAPTAPVAILIALLEALTALNPEGGTPK